LFSQLGTPSLARLKVGVFLVGLLPLWQLARKGWLNELGANPIESIERTLGYWTLMFLMVTLSVTPLRRLLGWAWLMRLRRMLGLFAFFYACQHFLAYAALDQFFDGAAIVKDVAKRPYVTVGFLAFLLLVPLAVTSTRRMMQRLGGKRWQRVHRLIYAAAIGGVVHYWWLVKKDISEPVRFALVLAVLLGYRIVYARFRAVSPPASLGAGVAERN
jgi:methionine sulfoxide reductase heme-binding subunit